MTVQRHIGTHFEVFNFIYVNGNLRRTLFLFTAKMSNQSRNSVKRNLIDDGNSETDKKLDKSIHLLRICNEFEGESKISPKNGITLYPLRINQFQTMRSTLTKRMKIERSGI